MRINLAVLPWANLDSPLTLSRVSFVPWSHHKKSMTDTVLRDLIQSFVSIFKKHGINKGKLQEVDPAVVLIDGKIDIQPDDSELLNRAINILFFLATSWDDMTYINSNAFEVFFNPINTDQSHYVFGPHRAMTIAADYRDIIITEPLNASGISRAFGMVRNRSYVAALERLLNSKRHGRVADASLNFYRLAYDDHYPNDYLKLGYLISAFETLFAGKGNRDVVIREVGKGVFSKKRTVVYDRKHQKRIGMPRPSGVVFKAYESRNGYLHNGQKRGLGAKLDGQLLPLWNLTVYAYQQYFLTCLENWKLLRWNKWEKAFLFDSKFDNRVKSLVEDARGRSEYINKKMQKEREQRKARLAAEKKVQKAH